MRRPQGRHRRVWHRRRRRRRRRRRPALFSAVAAAVALHQSLRAAARFFLFIRSSPASCLCLRRHRPKGPRAAKSGQQPLPKRSHRRPHGGSSSSAPCRQTRRSTSASAAASLPMPGRRKSALRGQCASSWPRILSDQVREQERDFVCVGGWRTRKREGTFGLTMVFRATSFFLFVWPRASEGDKGRSRPGHFLSFFYSTFDTGDRSWKRAGELPDREKESSRGDNRATKARWKKRVSSTKKAHFLFFLVLSFAKKKKKTSNRPRRRPLARAARDPVALRRGLPHAHGHGGHPGDRRPARLRAALPAVSDLRKGTSEFFKTFFCSASFVARLFLFSPFSLFTIFCASC